MASISSSFDSDLSCDMHNVNNLAMVFVQHYTIKSAQSVNGRKPQTTLFSIDVQSIFITIWLLCFFSCIYLLFLNDLCI